MRKLALLCSCAWASSLCAWPLVAGADEPEEIVITTSPLGKTADELAAPVDVLRRDDLLDAAGATLGDTLASQPGVTTSSFAVGASRPVIRGQVQVRVRVLENGLSTGDVSSVSPDHGVTLNPLVTQRLEIVRGPATLRYGGGAIAGVVNAITERIPTKPFGRPAAAEIYSAYGTGSRERNLAGLLQGDAGRFSWHLDAFSVDSRDYEIPGSPDRQFNTASDSYSFSGGGAWIGEKLRVGGSVTRFRSDYGIPAPEAPEIPSSISLEQDHYAIEADLNLGGAWIEQIRLHGARTEYLHDEIVEGEGPASTFDNEDIEVRTELVHPPLFGFKGALGIQFQDVDLVVDGEGGELLPPSESELLGVYLFESRDLTDRLNLELAGRVERSVVEGIDLDGNDRKQTFHPVSASAALLYGIGDAWSLGLTLTAAQRAPEALELFSQGPHDATATFELGDPGADEERALSVDLELRGAYGPLSGQLNVFGTRYRNFTFGRLTGTSQDEDGTRFDDPDSGELRDLVFTQDDANFLGAELELRWALAELRGGQLALELQSDVVRARLSSGDVPRIPPFRVGAAIVYSADRLSGRFGFQHTAAQNDLADFETRTSGYTTLDGSLRLRIAGSTERPIDLTLSARNLSNQRARNHVSFKKEDVLLPGRDIRLGIHARF
jgi:iron complex outermembrane receptor protein